MSLRPPLTDLFDIDHPVVQAPIGSATCPELAAAVTDAGGLGHLAVTWRSLDGTRSVVAETREATDGPFAVNLALDDRTTHLPTDEHLDAVLDAGAPVVSLSFGDPAPYVDRVHAAGATVMGTVGSAEEARYAVEAGVDAVVEHETVELDPEEFDPFAEHAAEGYTGGGYAWVVREEPPPLSDSMSEMDEAYPRVLLGLGRGADGWGPAGGGRKSEAPDAPTSSDGSHETDGESYEEAAIREVREETGVGSIDVRESELNGAAWFHDPPAELHRSVEDHPWSWAEWHEGR